MTIHNHRYLKNFKHYLLRGFLKIPLMINFIVYIRYVYFFHIKKSFKSFYPIENKIVKRNYKQVKMNIFNFVRVYNLFNPVKKELRFFPLKALNFLKPLNMKVLTIGPRDETEIFVLVSLGFQLKNISALDIHKYSNLITLGDAMDIPFEKNSFG